MRWTRKLFRVVAMLILAIPILLLSALGGARFAGYSTQIIATGSMEPIIGRGSVVLMRPLPADDVRVGQVVLVPRPPRDGRPLAPVMHRVVSIRREDGFMAVGTKGDANPAPDPDPYVLKTRTMTPVLVLPYFGFLLNELRTPRGWFLLAVLPVSLRAIVVLRRVWSDGDARVLPSSLVPVDA
jgi:signal peptidase I